MRWISIVLMVCLVSACTALKPVINNKSATPASERRTQPVFIENISTSSPEHSRVRTQPVIHNTSGVNTFNTDHRVPEAYHGIQFKYAILMNVPIESLENLKLFAFIDDWYGTPYHFGGNSRSGIDCSAFSAGLMTNVFGVGLPRMAKDQYNVCEHIRKDGLAEGDLVFFHTTRKGISHVGVYLGNNKFVHASLAYGVTISDLTDPYYARTFRGGGRVKMPAADTATTAGN